MSERRSGSAHVVRYAVVLFVFLLTRWTSPAHAQSPSGRWIAELSLDELANLEVTSVSRSPESIADAPAAIFVITAEDIRRSGAATLAEALRLAPNLQVARADAGQYAISARGFNGFVANKLLVLVDGRSIYTPLFSGVFWDQQDVLVEDIERIEVISGPGAALWGANAVNGVINVITRSARDTHGVLVSAGVGSQQQGAAVRYGGALGEGGHYRIYGKLTHQENNIRADGTEVPNGLRWIQGGFRLDWEDASGGVTVQGDAHGVRSVDRGRVGTFDLGRAELSGVNLLTRWTRRRDSSELQVQAYVDHTERRERILFQPRTTLYDLELQHGLSRGAHRFVWGAGYRHAQDDVEDGVLVGFRPTSREQAWLNVYGQDSIRLGEALNLEAGLRLDRNDYTGWEVQPDVRLGWKLRSEELLWGGVSRAIRAPARLDRDVIIPFPQGLIVGGPNFVSEVATVLQLGYRARTAGVVNWSLTGFLHQWDHLRSGTPPPVVIENRIEGPAYGMEGWASWQALSAWRLSGGFSTLRKDLRLEAGSTDPVGTANPQLSNDPGHQWMLRSSLNPWTGVELDAMVRHVAELPHPIVPAYTAVDVRCAWRLRHDLELSVLARNLFDRSHPEFNAAPDRSELERGILVQARWVR